MVKLFEQHGQEIQTLLTVGDPRAHTPGTPEATAERSELSVRRRCACKHPVIVPAINYSAGQPQLLRRPITLQARPSVPLGGCCPGDKCGPRIFPRHTNNNQYVDGGLYANAPGCYSIQQPEAMP
jgi:hypothetical protein